MGGAGRAAGVTAGMVEKMGGREGGGYREKGGEYEQPGRNVMRG